MLEIIALIYLCKKTGETAAQKGLSSSRWKLYTVLAWFGAEFAGFFLGAIFFGTGNLVGLLLFALICGVGGYLILKVQLDKIPGTMDDDIERIGE